MSKKGLGHLGRLSNGERLLLNRRRGGESQREAAECFETTLFIYGQWERDVVTGPRPSRLDGRSVEPHERCLLYRRRLGDSQELIASVLGRCRWWVNLMERGLVPCDELIGYWEG